MADAMDLVQQRVEEELSRLLASAVKRTSNPSAFSCQDCGCEIPEIRRRTIQGVCRCVSCQEIIENRLKHNRS